MNLWPIFKDSQYIFCMNQWPERHRQGGKLESIERMTNPLLVLVFPWDVDSRKHIE